MKESAAPGREALRSPVAPRVEDLSPYLSLRILSIDNADKNWTSTLVDLAYGVEALLPAVFTAEELKRITRIAGRFLPCGSERSSEYIAPNEPGLLDRLKRERTGWMAGCALPVHTKPSWLKRAGASNLKNTIHHLLNVAILPPFIAISSTREGLGTAFVALLEDESALAENLSQRLTAVPTEVLDKTFVRGEAFNVWLDGLHRPTVFKADKQTMMGLDLRRALDPIGHRTFAYSSVRSRLQAELPMKTPPAAVGYSKASGMLWLGTTSDSHDYMRQLSVLCDLTLETITSPGKVPRARLEDEEASRFGFRHLSQEIDPDRIMEAKEPFEVELDLGEPTEGEILGETDRSAATEAWRTNGQFQIASRPMGQTLAVTNPKELIIPVQALWNGKVFREFDLVVHPSIDRKLHVASERMKDYPSPGGSFLSAFEVFDALDADLGPKAFMVRFDSGHVLNRERLYLPLPPAVPFEDWQWVDLKVGNRQYDVRKEKPGNWSVTRSRRNFRKVQSGNDLFSYVVNNIERLDVLASSREWYVLCHDQPQEVADFVVIAPAERMVSHIHVKGANNDDPGRRVAIGAYDLVVTQAIKNLPRLDVSTLMAALQKASHSDREVGQFIVNRNAGEVTRSMDCTPFMEALHRMSTRPLLSKQVVIFQPQVRAALWLGKVEEWRKSNDPLSVKSIQPVFMLSSLLMDAKIACMRLGASFSVWGASDIAESELDTIPKLQRSPFREEAAADQTTDVTSV